MVKNLIKIWPVLIIFFVWFAFSSPYFLKGLAPFPSDYLMNNFDPWNEYDLSTGPVKNSAAPDVITQIYPWKRLVIDTLKEGAFPLWNPYSFSGTPLLANYQSAALSPLNLLYFILPFEDGWSISILLQPLLAGIFTFFYLRTVNRSLEASAFGGVAFMFCGFITSWMLYGTLGFAILYLPLALFAIEKFYQTKKWQYFSLLSVSIPLSFFSGHFQTSLYFLLFLCIYILFKSITSKKDLKLFLLNISAVLFGLMLSLPQLLPSIEFYLNSSRSSTFLITEIIPWKYIPTLFAPDFFGNPVTRNDWFGHFAEWNAYIGLLPLLFAFYSLKKKNIYTFFFASVSVATLLLAFQTPIQEIIRNLHIPVLSTSAAGRIIVLFSFSLATLSSFGFDLLRQDIEQKKFKFAIFWLLSFTSVFILFWVLVVFNIYVPADKRAISLSNLRLPTLIFAVSSFFIIISFFVKHKKFKLIFPVLLIAILSFDVLRFALKWQPFQPKKYMFPDVKVSDQFRKIAPEDRILANFGAEGSTTFKIASTEGYDPLYIERYGQFLSSVSNGKLRETQRSVVAFPRRADFMSEMINFLGIKFIVHKVADEGKVWTFPYWEFGPTRFKLVYQDGKYQVYENTKVLPRAILSGEYRLARDKKQIIEEFYKQRGVFGEKIILEKAPILKIEKSDQFLTGIKTYSSNLIRLDTYSPTNSILLLTDPYYPGWKAYVDRKEVPILRANFAFRAVEVPAGTHIVTFIYSPDSFKIGIIFSIIGLAGIAGFSYYLRRL